VGGSRQAVVGGQCKQLEVNAVRGQEELMLIMGIGVCSREY